MRTGQLFVNPIPGRDKSIVEAISDQGPYILTYGSGLPGVESGLHCVTCGYVAVSVEDMYTASRHNAVCMWRRAVEARGRRVE